MEKQREIIETFLKLLLVSEEIENEADFIKTPEFIHLSQIDFGLAQSMREEIRKEVNGGEVSLENFINRLNFDDSFSMLKDTIITQKDYSVLDFLMKSSNDFLNSVSSKEIKEIVEREQSLPIEQRAEPNLLIELLISKKDNALLKEVIQEFHFDKTSKTKAIIETKDKDFITSSIQEFNLDEYYINAYIVGTEDIEFIKSCILDKRIPLTLPIAVNEIMNSRYGELTEEFLSSVGIDKTLSHVCALICNKGDITNDETLRNLPTETIESYKNQALRIYINCVLKSYKKLDKEDEVLRQYMSAEEIEKTAIDLMKDFTLKLHNSGITLEINNRYFLTNPEEALRAMQEYIQIIANQGTEKSKQNQDVFFKKYFFTETILLLAKEPNIEGLEQMKENMKKLFNEPQKVFQSTNFEELFSDMSGTLLLNELSEQPNKSVQDLSEDNIRDINRHLQLSLIASREKNTEITEKTKKHLRIYLEKIYPYSNVKDSKFIFEEIDAIRKQKENVNSTYCLDLTEYQLAAKLAEKIGTVKEQSELDICFELYSKMFSTTSFVKRMTKEVFEKIQDNGLKLHSSKAFKKCFDGAIDELLSAKDLKKSYSIDVSKLIIRTFNAVMREKNDIFQNQIMSDIIQLAYANRMSEGQNTSLKNFIEKKISKIDVKKEKEAVQEYINKSNQGELNSENEFDTFIAHLKQFKLASLHSKGIGHIDRKYIDFVIKQALNPNSVMAKNPTKYQFLLERTLEDLTRSDAGERGRKSGYCFFVRDLVNDKETTLGCHFSTSRKIEVKRECIEQLIKGDSIHILNTIFHENTHLKQYCDIEESKFKTYSYYMMLKENIIRSKRGDYYDNNYSNMYAEIDAREMGSKGISDYLQRIEGEIDPSTKENIAKMLIKETIEDYKETYEAAVTKEISDKQKGKTKEKVTDTFEQTLLEMKEAEREETIRENPLLLIEYNSDGKAKTVSEFLEGLKDIKKTGVRFGMCREILKKGNIFKSENVIQDIQALSQPISEEQKHKSFIRGAVSLIVADNVGRMLQEAERSILEDINVTEFQKVRALQKGLKEVETQMQKGECTPEFIKGMQRAKEGKSAETVLKEVQARLVQRFGELPVDFEEASTEEITSEEITSTEVSSSESSHKISRDDIKYCVGEMYKNNMQDVQNASAILGKQLEHQAKQER